MFTNGWKQTLEKHRGHSFFFATAVFRVIFGPKNKAPILGTNENTA